MMNIYQRAQCEQEIVGEYAGCGHALYPRRKPNERMLRDGSTACKRERRVSFSQRRSVMPAEGKAKFLTNPADFTDVSRGDPKPWSLKGEALVKARLTPETWRLEIVSDGSTQ